MMAGERRGRRSVGGGDRSRGKTRWCKEGE